MSKSLSKDELINLISSVFAPKSKETSIAILVDAPDAIVPDNPHWKARREMAADWQEKLSDSSSPFHEVVIIYYPNVHKNNANLPDVGYKLHTAPKKLTMDTLLSQGEQINMSQIMDDYPLFIALTELSATAPLKLAAPKHNFRAVTMPGFSIDMIPALRLDYKIVNDRIMTIKQILDPAIALDITFNLENNQTCSIHFDLRNRKATASGGRFPEMGKAGNLPGGECYIVPYEGELDEDSETHGTLPVQFGKETVLYEIVENRAVSIKSEGSKSKEEKAYIEREPAYGNMAEVGFGILSDFGIQPTGNILLDEKLGLHIAFGRSDHFGGRVGIDDFSAPDQVVHLDRIYIPETQPNVSVVSVIATMSSGDSKTIIKDNQYLVFD